MLDQAEETVQKGEPMSTGSDGRGRTYDPTHTGTHPASTTGGERRVDIIEPAPGPDSARIDPVRTDPALTDPATRDPATAPRDDYAAGSNTWRRMQGWQVAGLVAFLILVLLIWWLA